MTQQWPVPDGGDEDEEATWNELVVGFPDAAPLATRTSYVYVPVCVGVNV